MSILSLKNVNKSYGDAAILKNINLEVEEGEFIAIVGFSGSGKTTLMNILTGLELPDGGEALYKGVQIDGPSSERGLVFQNYSLMPWLTVNGNVALAVNSVHGDKTKEERSALVAKYVDMVGLSHATERRPAELSGGMRQRVSVARALAMQPDVLLLDEPLSALDALTRANLQDEIDAISQKEKKTIILITNDVDEAILLADRIVPLNPGPQASFGPEFKVEIPRPRDRTKMNDSVEFIELRKNVTQYLMDVGFAAASTQNRILPDVTAVHHLRPAAVREAAKSGSPNDDRYLQFSQVHKVYPTPKGPLTVVEDFELTLKKGEFVSIIGHSGCGKSTALTMAAGLNPISKGGIILDGTHIEGADPERAVVFQSPNLFPWLSAKENVSIGVDKVYPKATRQERQDVVEYYLERVGLADSMDKRAVDLSNGMRQRVGIARAFALSPKLLLLDEPFGMLDSLTRWELQEVLMEVWSKTKVTAICVTHDVDEAVLLSDRVCMMTNGPQAKVGKLMNVDLPRPRTRKALLEHPDYYRYRAEVLQFLEDYEHGDPVAKDNKKTGTGEAA
ncbi:MAG: ABC transporter ATP-binding protein [Rhodobacteraceae bacterium]|nr:ABC transporter ATP-binding protein [Paracoccaceae bacterium]